MKTRQLLIILVGFFSFLPTGCNRNNITTKEMIDSCYSLSTNFTSSLDSNFIVLATYIDSLKVIDDTEKSYDSVCAYVYYAKLKNKYDTSIESVVKYNLITEKRDTIIKPSMKLSGGFRQYDNTLCFFDDYESWEESYIPDEFIYYKGRDFRMIDLETDSVTTLWNIWEKVSEDNRKTWHPSKYSLDVLMDVRLGEDRLFVSYQTDCSECRACDVVTTITRKYEIYPVTISNWRKIHKEINNSVSDECKRNIEQKALEEEKKKERALEEKRKNEEREMTRKYYWINGTWRHGNDAIHINFNERSILVMNNGEVWYKGTFSINGDQIWYDQQNGYHSSFDLKYWYLQNQGIYDGVIGDKRAGIWFRRIR